MREVKDGMLPVWLEGLKLSQARGCMGGLGCAAVAGTSMLPWSTGETSAKCITGSSEVSHSVKTHVKTNLLSTSDERNDTD